MTVSEESLYCQLPFHASATLSVAADEIGAGYVDRVTTDTNTMPNHMTPFVPPAGVQSSQSTERIVGYVLHNSILPQTVIKLQGGDS